MGTRCVLKVRTRHYGGAARAIFTMMTAMDLMNDYEDTIGAIGAKGVIMFVYTPFSAKGFLRAERDE